MNRKILMTTLLMTSAVYAQPTIPWFTIDGGGQTFSTGGSYELGGTIGQPDASSFASPLSGGSFTLVGGFWPVVTNACACPGDMNADGKKDGRDIQRFVSCLISGGDCSCADLNGLNGPDVNDISGFVVNLLNGPACP